MDAVMLRIMPVQEPWRIVQFGSDLSYPLFRQFGQELGCFEEISLDARILCATSATGWLVV